MENAAVTLEQAQTLLADLQAEAVANPTQEELAAHHERVAELLESFPESIRQQLVVTDQHNEQQQQELPPQKMTKAQRKNQARALKRAKERAKKEKAMERKREAVAAAKVPPAATVAVPASSSETRPCSYLQATAKPIHYLAILDFEATCNDRGPRPSPQEIIEFPTILLNVETNQVESTFHTYVKPDYHPVLSPFCAQLTGITQEQVDNGVSLAEALRLHDEWLEQHGIVSVACNSNDDDTRKNFCYVTCGDWDLQSCLPNQMKHWTGSPAPPPGFAYWINLKKPFGALYRKRCTGMTGMLQELGLKLKGRHHSGIDDCRNLVRIGQSMLLDGWKPKIT